MKTWHEQLLYLNQLAATDSLVFKLAFVSWFIVAIGVVLMVVGAFMSQGPAEVIGVAALERAPAKRRWRGVLQIAILLAGLALILIGGVQGQLSSKTYRLAADHAADLLKDVFRKSDKQTGGGASIDEKTTKLTEVVNALETMQALKRDEEVELMLDKFEGQIEAYAQISATERSAPARP